MLIYGTGVKYQETHKRCAPNIVAIEYRLNEKCGMLPIAFNGLTVLELMRIPGDCRESTSPRYTMKRKNSSGASSSGSKPR